MLGQPQAEASVSEGIFGKEAAKSGFNKKLGPTAVVTAASTTSRNTATKDTSMCSQTNVC